VPEVVITGFRRQNRVESVGDSGSVLERSITETREIRLSHRDNVLSFEFAALDYSAPSKNRYVYRMRGFSDAWIEAETTRTATFTNLRPGSYTFEVRGSNNDGVWNEAGASLALTILPPWWRTRWAMGLYVLILVGSGGMGLRRYDMNRLRLEHRLRREHEEAEQLRELDRARSRFFANVSHEFRTPLTLTLGPLDDLRSGFHGPLPAPVTGAGGAGPPERRAGAGVDRPAPGGGPAGGGEHATPCPEPGSWGAFCDGSRPSSNPWREGGGCGSR
jgi:signal transduction histidine kinase